MLKCDFLCIAVYLLNYDSVLDVLDICRKLFQNPLCFSNRDFRKKNGVFITGPCPNYGVMNCENKTP